MNTKTAHKHLELTTKALTLLARLKASDYVAKVTKRVKATIRRLKAMLRKAISPSKALEVVLYQDPLHPSQTWLVKRSKHGHYFVKGQYNGVDCSTRYVRTTVRSLRLLGVAI